MEEGKRIRLIFRDDDILSDAQKLEGLTRSWLLLKPHQHDAVSDLASHLLHDFQLHPSCPHGLLLSISGFVLPPFESTHILKDDEIISVRKRKDSLSIEGNDAANDARKLKALGKQPVNDGVLLLTSEEFEKEKGGYENDEPQEEYEDDDDGGVLEVANTRKRKRKAAERLQGYKKKKQCAVAKHSGNTSSDVCKEKKDGSIAGDCLEKRDDPAKHSDTNIVIGDGVRRKKKQFYEAKHSGNNTSDVCKEKKDDSMAVDIVENKDEPAKHINTNILFGDGMRQKKKQRSGAMHNKNTSSGVCQKKKDGSIDGDDVGNSDEPAEHSDKNNAPEVCAKRTANVQEEDKETDNTKVAPGETTKVASRSARRKKSKRLFRREMAKIKMQNATCESEGLRNWKEDQAKVDREKLDRQWKRQKKWDNNHADAESNEADAQPKGLLHWKLSAQNNGFVKGKRHKKHHQNGDFLELSNQNGDVHKQQNNKGDKDEHLTQTGDISEQPNQSLHEQPGQNCVAVVEHTNQNCDSSKQSSQERAEENEVFPVVVRPGHIRFEPLEEGEHVVQQDHAPLETFNWNGITSKKKGQQWGKENRRFNPRNEYKTDEENSETLTKEKDKQPNESIGFDKWGKENQRFTPRNDYKTDEGKSETLIKEKDKLPNERIDFDKLPPLTGIPKKGDLIAYRVLELSSTWTPELSAHRVGMVSWYNAESNEIMLLPVSEYPIVTEKDDGDDEAGQPDNSLYKEDGSLEIDFPSLIDVRVLINGNGGSEPGNEPVKHVSEASSGNGDATMKTAVPSSDDKPTVDPSPDTQEPNQSKEMQPPTAEESGGSIWDQLSESLKARKEQLAKENGWGSSPKKVLVPRKPQNSSPRTNSGKKPQPSQDNSWGKQSSTGSKSWSYKALRGSALGPTMAMLRSQKDA